MIEITIQISQGSLCIERSPCHVWLLREGFVLSFVMCLCCLSREWAKLFLLCLLVLKSSGFLKSEGLKTVFENLKTSFENSTHRHLFLEPSHYWKLWKRCSCFELPVYISLYWYSYRLYANCNTYLLAGSLV